MSANDKLDKLRLSAIELLKQHGMDNEKLNAWGNDVKDLLQELSIYHVELEQQNKALDQSEKELAQAHEEYVELFENAPVGYVVIDRDRIIRKVNRTFINAFVPHQSLGMPVEGRCFDEFVSAEFRGTFQLFCKMLKKPGIPVPVELKLLDRTSMSHYVLLTAGERQKESELFRLNISDIAMLKKMEAALVKAKEDVEEHDRQKSLFLTSVSHELRTPLMTLIGFSEMMNDPQLDAAGRSECASAIQFSGKLLQTLADEVLDLSVLESGIVPLRNSDTDLARICRETVELVQRSITDKNVLVQSEMDNIPHLWTDQMRLRQAIFAILDHAAGNATSGCMMLRGSYEEGEKSGEGILVLNFTGTNIFSGESSLEMDIQRKPVSQNCAGLGLYLAKQLFQALKGQMTWVHPLDALRVEIPVQKSHLQPVTRNMDADQAQFKQMKCLLVDDVVLNLKVLAAMLKKLGCESDLASSGKEALELLGRHPYDMVFSDLWMPEMSGEELVEQIRQNTSFDRLPLIAVTADVEREKNFDMSFFTKTIIKPVSLEKLKKLFQELNFSQLNAAASSGGDAGSSAQKSAGEQKK